METGKGKRGVDEGAMAADTGGLRRAGGFYALSAGGRAHRRRLIRIDLGVLLAHRSGAQDVRCIPYVQRRRARLLEPADPFRQTLAYVRNSTLHSHSVERCSFHTIHATKVCVCVNTLVFWV